MPNLRRIIDRLPSARSAVRSCHAQRLLEMTSLVADTGFQVVSLRLMMSVFLGDVTHHLMSWLTRGLA